MSGTLDNSYRGNVRTPAEANPEIIAVGPRDQRFFDLANDVLEAGAEALRAVVPSHQSAIAVVVDHDWLTIHKYFSLSSKYVKWADFDVPARGLGMHDWLLDQPGSVAMTSDEFESHPAFRHFNGLSGHPPMRGWLAAPIRSRDGRGYGIAQVSDKMDGSDYVDADRQPFDAAVKLISMTLQAGWDLRDASPTE